MSTTNFPEKNIKTTVPGPMQQEAHSAKSFLEKSKGFFARHYKHIFALMAAGGLGYTAYQARDEVKGTLRDVSETVLGKREEPLSPEHKKYVELLEAGNTEEFYRLYNAECLAKEKNAPGILKENRLKDSRTFNRMATYSVHAGALDEAKLYLDQAINALTPEKTKDFRRDLIEENLAQTHFTYGLFFVKKGKWDDAVHSFTESLTYDKSDIETKSYIDFCLAQMNQAPSKDALSRLAPEELAQNIAIRSEAYNRNSIQPPSLTDFYAQQVKFEQERRLEYLRAAQKRIFNHANTGKSLKSPE